MAGSVHVSMAAVTTPPQVASVEPSTGAVVGVASPVTVTFKDAVQNRSAVERSISVSSPSKAAEASMPDGKFSWLSSDTVQWQPEGFLPAHSPISVHVGPLSTDFKTGAEVLGVADVDAHTFTVSIDGEVARQMPASMGKPKHPTPIGSFSVLGKERQVVMDSRTIGIPLSDPEGYKLTVNYAVRITWGGVYVHSAPWSVSDQGNSNVSHGCINLSPDNASWYFNTVGMGDPVVVQA